MRRRDLKPAKRVDDETFLRAAQASATRAANRLERARRAELVDAELRSQERATRPVKGEAERRANAE